MAASITIVNDTPCGYIKTGTRTFCGLPSDNQGGFFVPDPDQFMDLCYPVGEPFVYTKPTRNVIKRILQTPERPTPAYNFEDFTTPELRLKIKPHQVEIFEACIGKFNGRAIIAAEMGTGKSLDMSLLAAYYKTSTLIICPASLMGVLKEQLIKWTAQDSFCFDKGSKIIPEDARIVITTYTLATTSDKILSRRFRLIVADESHYLANSDTARTSTLMPFMQKADFVFLMSGTPQKAKPSELFAQINIVCPDLFSYKDYTERYCAGKLQPWGKWVCEGHKQEEELHILLKTFMIRYKTEDVLDLPNLNRVIVELDVDTSGIDFMREEAKDLREEKAKAKVDEQESYENKLNVCYQEMWRESGRAKINKALTWFYEEFKKSDKKWALFAHHKAIMTKIKEFLDEKQISHIYIDGSVNPKKRLDLVKSAADPKGTDRIALLSLNTSSIGFTLCPGVTRMVFFELIHSPSVINQAERRVYREGCIEDVIVYWLVGKNTHDQSIMNTLKYKDRTNQLIIDG